MDGYCSVCGRPCDACTFKIVRRVVKDKKGNVRPLLVVEPKCLDCSEKEFKEHLI